MANVTMNEYLEDSDVLLNVTINMDCMPSEQAYEIEYAGASAGWLTGKELDTVIKTLQKAKRILKTRTLKEGD